MPCRRPRMRDLHSAILSDIIDNQRRTSRSRATPSESAGAGVTGLHSPRGCDRDGGCRPRAGAHLCRLHGGRGALRPPAPKSGSSVPGLLDGQLDHRPLALRLARPRRFCSQKGPARVDRSSPRRRRELVPRRFEAGPLLHRRRPGCQRSAPARSPGGTEAAVVGVASATPPWWPLLSIVRSSASRMIFPVAVLDGSSIVVRPRRSCPVANQTRSPLLRRHGGAEAVDHVPSDALPSCRSAQVMNQDASRVDRRWLRRVKHACERFVRWHGLGASEDGRRFGPMVAELQRARDGVQRRRREAAAPQVHPKRRKHPTLRLHPAKRNPTRCRNFVKVELARLELATSWVRSRRSPN